MRARGLPLVASEAAQRAPAPRPPEGLVPPEGRTLSGDELLVYARELAALMRGIGRVFVEKGVIVLQVEGRAQLRAASRLTARHLGHWPKGLNIRVFRAGAARAKNPE